jgi:hypothetical protein
MDAALMQEENRIARDKLKKLLESFDQNLQEVQHRFINLGSQPHTKKVKVKNGQRPGAATSSARSDQQSPLSTTNATFNIESVPTSQNLGSQHFLVNMHPLRSD